MRLFRRVVTWLFFRFCYQRSELAKWIVAHYVPGVMRKMDGTRIDGDYYIAEVNRITGEQKPWIDIRIRERADNGEEQE